MLWGLVAQIIFNILKCFPSNSNSVNGIILELTFQCIQIMNLLNITFLKKRSFKLSILFLKWKCNLHHACCYSDHIGLQCFKWKNFDIWLMHTLHIDWKLHVKSMLAKVLWAINWRCIAYGMIGKSKQWCVNLDL
jgi:hypothetical protein